MVNVNVLPTLSANPTNLPDLSPDSDGNDVSSSQKYTCSYHQKQSNMLISCVTPDNTVIGIALSREGHDV